MMTERVYVKSESLGEIHDLINRYEQIGWSKAGALMYTHDGDKQGWEMAMERPVEPMVTHDPRVYNVLGWVGVSIVGLVLGAAAWAAVGALMEHL